MFIIANHSNERGKAAKLSFGAVLSAAACLLFFFLTFMVAVCTVFDGDAQLSLRVGGVVYVLIFSSPLFRLVSGLIKLQKKLERLMEESNFLSLFVGIKHGGFLVLASIMF